MGLGWSYLLPGLIWEACCIGVVTAVYLGGSAFKRTRTAFHDERMSEPQRQSHDVPGPRRGALRDRPARGDRLPRRAAVDADPPVRTSGGAWSSARCCSACGTSCRASARTSRTRPSAPSSVRGGAATSSPIALSVLTTTIAGVLFAALRLFSGSVLAPMGLPLGDERPRVRVLLAAHPDAGPPPGAAPPEVRAGTARREREDGPRRTRRFGWSRMTAVGFTPYDDAESEGAPDEGGPEATSRRGTTDRRTPGWMQHDRPSSHEGMAASLERPGPPHPGVRAPVVEVRRGQGAGDPRPVRHERHALLPAAQRTHR